ncbi:IclR family transcriptional regulator [Geodermatophilus sabuli]|uniref:IclR family transcriptional regulator n=1 Tax=Geodermatophilus sabuli TaxID=1564158 RepID=A0A7K3W184_9ACTN|nr:IclR family transcriptional regulator [Geodermatophilus sabuli]NEK58626.1 IclR family transcriptional regulator [Geodermatophilus sabuli]
MTPSRTSGGKLLAVLDAFTRERSALTLSEIARAVGVPLSTAHRLVGELRRWGGLERDLDGRFRIGLRVWEIGALAPRGLGLREAALPFMEDLYEVTHQNVQLAVREDVEVVFVERFASRSAVNVLTQVGGRFALAPTGVGQVLLAHAPVEVQERVLAAPMRKYTPHTITDPRHLRRLLADIRRTGFAISEQQVTPGGVSVAAPILSGDAVVAALSVVVPGTTAAAVRSVTPSVLAAARGISRVLTQSTGGGWPLEPPTVTPSPDPLPGRTSA